MRDGRERGTWEADISFDSTTPELVNVVHPMPVPWSKIISAVNGEFERRVPLVTLEDWVKRLEALAEGASARDLETTVSPP